MRWSRSGGALRHLLPVQPIHTLLQEGYAGQHIVPDLLHPCTLTLTVTAMQSRRGGAVWCLLVRCVTSRLACTRALCSLKPTAAHQVTCGWQCQV